MISSIVRTRILNIPITPAFSYLNGPVRTSLNSSFQIRCKTYVKKPTKARKRFLKLVLKAKQENASFGFRKKPVLENRFWKVEGPLKVYKPLTNGLKGRISLTRYHLWKGSAIKRLSFGKRSTGGRNSSGRITVRHRGGGHKRRIRKVDFVKEVQGKFEVVRLEYDPNRTADLALLRHVSTNEFYYIIRPNGLNPGQVVYNYSKGIPAEKATGDPVAQAELFSPGNTFQLFDIPLGLEIHAIGLRAGGKGALCRSAGTCGRLVYKPESSDGMCHVKLQSGEVRFIPAKAIASIGMVGNELHFKENLGKAGVKRHKGIRPTVRGIAMDPNNHPHGGGSKSKGNKDPRSPWGWKTKGFKTVRKKQWHIVLPRWKAKSTA